MQSKNVGEKNASMPRRVDSLIDADAAFSSAASVAATSGVLPSLAYFRR